MTLEMWPIADGLKLIPVENSLRIQKFNFGFNQLLKAGKLTTLRSVTRRSRVGRGRWLLRNCSGNVCKSGSIINYLLEI